MPATRVVDTLQDVVDQTDNKTSLREAIQQLNPIEGDHTITFAQNIQGGTITLDPNEGQLSVTTAGSNITIDGSGNFMTIQRDPYSQQQHRLFSVGLSNTLNLVNLNLLWGWAAGGGAIASNGNLIINHCWLGYNSSSDAGGAIAQLRGDLLILDSVISFNSAVNGGGISVFTEATSTVIYNTTLEWNSAQEAGGGIEILGSDGQTAKTVILDDVGVYDNGAQEAGGGIYVNGGTVGTDLTLQNDTFVSDNWVTNPDPMYQTKGGGIYFGRERSQRPV
ncbi:MAG: hypothetical protein L0241_04365 [Planctomycetia bacterium]|nr:hypothetical protein [Planctomycetia bacterium]